MAWLGTLHAGIRMLLDTVVLGVLLLVHFFLLFQFGVPLIFVIISIVVIVVAMLFVIINVFIVIIDLKLILCRRVEDSRTVRTSNGSSPIEWARHRSAPSPLTETNQHECASLSYDVKTLTQKQTWGVGVSLAQKLGAKRPVTIGMALETFGLIWVAVRIGPQVTLLSLLPAILTYGIGIGFATAQLGNITLAEIPQHIAGVASGVNQHSSPGGRCHWDSHRWGCV